MPPGGSAILSGGCRADGDRILPLGVRMSAGSLKLVLFDCDGTLVDSQHAIVSAMTRGWRAMGLGDPDPVLVLEPASRTLPSEPTAIEFATSSPSPSDRSSTPALPNVESSAPGPVAAAAALLPAALELAVLSAVVPVLDPQAARLTHNRPVATVAATWIFVGRS